MALVFPLRTQHVLLEKALDPCRSFLFFIKDLTEGKDLNIFNQKVEMALPVSMKDGPSFFIGRVGVDQDSQPSLFSFSISALSILAFLKGCPLQGCGHGSEARGSPVKSRARSRGSIVKKASKQMTVETS